MEVAEAAVDVAEEDVEAEDVDVGDEDECKAEEVAGVGKDEAGEEEEVGALVVLETGATGVSGVTAGVVAMKSVVRDGEQKEVMATHSQKGMRWGPCPPGQQGGVRHSGSACAENRDDGETFCCVLQNVFTGDMFVRSE